MKDENRGLRRLLIVSLAMNGFVIAALIHLSQRVDDVRRRVERSEQTATALREAAPIHSATFLSPTLEQMNRGMLLDAAERQQHAPAPPSSLPGRLVPETTTFNPGPITPDNITPVPDAIFQIVPQK